MKSPRPVPGAWRIRARGFPPSPSSRHRLDRNQGNCKACPVQVVTRGRGTFALGAAPGGRFPSSQTLAKNRLEPCCACCSEMDFRTARPTRVGNGFKTTEPMIDAMRMLRSAEHQFVGRAPGVAPRFLARIFLI